ncbi:MAG: hypothetical protein IT361_01145 [Gemmatimonadaceae bacterium]|nr:hypothetical protein [Gemmatimonadaceae bacterium]
MMRRLCCVAGFVLACAPAADRPAPPGPATFGMESHGAVVLQVGDAVTLTHTFHDSAGTVITDASPTWTSGAEAVATVDARGRVEARALGEAEVVARVDRATVRTRVRVVPAPTGGAPIVDVFPRVEHQVIRAWEASGQLGELDCNPTAYANYKQELIARSIDELGITRLRTTARSGTERPDDTFLDYRAGRLNYPLWRRTWFVAANDNDDPFVVNPAGFTWGFFDHHMDEVVTPIRNAMLARGETLSVNLNYVDFYLGDASKRFPTMKDPEEYAELIRAIFDHMHSREGWVPDAVELNLEPEHTPYTGEDMGRALVAVARRLRAGGYRPAFIGPSTTKASNAPLYYDAMMRVPGARGLISEVAYHRYTGVSRATLREILVRARRDGAAPAMLEHIPSGFESLYDDLTIANAVAWERFALGYCGMRDNPDGDGVYYQINQRDPAKPRINFTRDARLLRQVFYYVRPGATRIGATSSEEAVRPLAFRDRAGRLVIVVQVPGPTTFTLRGISAGRYKLNYGTHAGPYNQNLPDVVAVDGTPLRVTMPHAGVITVYADGVR